MGGQQKNEQHINCTKKKSKIQLNSFPLKIQTFDELRSTRVINSAGSIKDLLAKDDYISIKQERVEIHPHELSKVGSPSEQKRESTIRELFNLSSSPSKD